MPPRRSASGKRDWRAYGSTTSHGKGPTPCLPQGAGRGLGAGRDLQTRRRPPGTAAQQPHERQGCAVQERVGLREVATSAPGPRAKFDRRGSAPARTEVSSGASTEAKTAPGPAVRSVSAAQRKWGAPAPPTRRRWAAVWRRFQARLYGSGRDHEAACSWRGRGRSFLRRTRLIFLFSIRTSRSPGLAIGSSRPQARRMRVASNGRLAPEPPAYIFHAFPFSCLPCCS